MRHANLAALALALLALGACGRDRVPATPPPPPPARAQVVRDVPKVARSVLVDTTGAADAEQVRYSVSAPFDSVTAFYRTTLPAQGWMIMGDQSDSAQLDLYAQRGDTALWVHVGKVSATATEYRLIGSVSKGRRAPADTGRH